MLGWAYALLPCVLKLLAAAGLHFLILRPAPALHRPTLQESPP